MSYKSEDAVLQLEAQAFDSQIEERLAAGLVPDLRRAGVCNYFYNNSWRHPDYVMLDFGEQLELICTSLQKFGSSGTGTMHVLEVGCGPGHMSLEMARKGYDVTGIDLSEKCIETASKVAQDDPWRADRGALNYICGDFLQDSTFRAGTFDAVIFIGALHHFPNQEEVARQVKRILRKKGLVLVHEPTRDRMNRGNAAFIHLLRLLLSQGNGFFKDVQIPAAHEEYERQVESIYREMRYEEESGEKKQSANDNEAGFTEMIAALNSQFEQVHFQERYAFFHELIGGLRYSEEKNKAMAWYLRSADAELCRLGVLQPTEFFYAGQLRG
jgi:2-polyprenyl-3-methyl-5-hydroxy-6-metoxy-1,4-benzoquinol methylase